VLQRHRTSCRNQRQTALDPRALVLPQNSYARCFMNGPFTRLHTRNGLESITTNNVAKGRAATPLSAALAFKWIHILLRCWKDHEPYDEAADQRALAHRRPEPPTEKTALQLQWKLLPALAKSLLPGPYRQAQMA
jgi:hypothetical protein